MNVIKDRDYEYHPLSTAADWASDLAGFHCWSDGSACFDHLPSADCQVGSKRLLIARIRSPVQILLSSSLIHIDSLQDREIHIFSMSLTECPF